MRAANASRRGSPGCVIRRSGWFFGQEVNLIVSCLISQSVREEKRAHYIIVTVSITNNKKEKKKKEKKEKEKKKEKVVEGPAIKLVQSS